MHRLFLFFAVLWIGLGLLMFGIGTLVTVTPVFTLLGVIFGSLGLFFLVVAIILRQVFAQRARDKQQIIDGGVDATGVVTFLDRNYSVRMNGRPPYFILEYKYADAFGGEHVATDRWADANQVIRRGLQVGSEIQVRYLPKSPEKIAVVF
jgi:hypothetical protein